MSESTLYFTLPNFTTTLDAQGRGPVSLQQWRRQSSSSSQCISRHPGTEGPVKGRVCPQGDPGRWRPLFLHHRRKHWDCTVYDQGDLPPVQWTPGVSLSDPPSWRFRPVWAAIRSSPSVPPVRGCMGSRHAGVKACPAPPWVRGLSKFLRGPSSSGRSFPTPPSGTGDRCPLLPQIMSARP